MIDLKKKESKPNQIFISKKEEKKLKKGDMIWIYITMKRPLLPIFSQNGQDYNKIVYTKSCVMFMYSKCIISYFWFIHSFIHFYICRCVETAIVIVIIFYMSLFILPYFRLENVQMQQRWCVRGSEMHTPFKQDIHSIVLNVSFIWLYTT